MSLPVPGINSWVTISQADIYFLDKWGASSVWAGLTISQKSQLLISAYRWLQGLADYSLPPTNISAKIKQAQCEAAWFIYRFNEEAEKRRALYAQGVRTFRVSEFSETLEEQILPANIAGLLAGFVTGLGGSIVKIDRMEESNIGDGTIGR
jgi:hypothetical protein